MEGSLTRPSRHKDYATTLTTFVKNISKISVGVKLFRGWMMVHELNPVCFRVCHSRSILQFSSCSNERVSEPHALNRDSNVERSA